MSFATALPRPAQLACHFVTGVVIFVKCNLKSFYSFPFFSQFKLFLNRSYITKRKLASSAGAVRITITITNKTNYNLSVRTSLCGATVFDYSRLKPPLRRYN